MVIPCEDTQLVIDVQFRIIPDKPPAVISIVDMVHSCLDISIQKHYLQLADHVHKLQMEKIFLVNNCIRSEMPFSLKMEPYLKTYYTSFGDPSIRSIKRLLKRG